MTVTSVQTLALVVGAAGTGAAKSGVPLDGGDSSATYGTSVITAGGGKKAGYQGGLGGACAFTDVISTSSHIGGQGGSAQYGGGGGGASGSPSADGGNGGLGGFANECQLNIDGGAGGTVAGTGGAGGAGEAIVNGAGSAASPGAAPGGGGGGAGYAYCGDDEYYGNSGSGARGQIILSFQSPPVPSPVSTPTLGEWAQYTLALLLLGFGGWRLRGQRRR